MKQVLQLVDDAEEFAPEPPHPLRRPLPPSEPFPVDALGPLLASAVRALHDELVQAPVSICAQAVLAVVTLAVQGRRNVRLPHGRDVPISEFFLTIAESGERKTTADEFVLRAVQDRERDLRDAHIPTLQHHDDAFAVWTTERQAVLHNKKLNREERLTQLQEIGAAPVRPLEPMLTCPEPTFEGLTKLFAIGHPSLGLFSSEGGQFIGGHGMSDTEKIKTAAGLSSVWDGTPIKRVRGGDGASTLPGRRLTMHLQVQPSVAARLLSDLVLQGQGLFSRFLTVAPETAAGTRLWKTPFARSHRRAESLHRNHRRPACAPPSPPYRHQQRARATGDETVRRSDPALR